MAKKNNIRSIRFSDEMIEMIESQAGERKEETMKEYAPWYIVCFRIIGILSLTLISFAFLFLNLCGVIVICDTITGLALQEMILNLCDEYPTAAVVITIIGYIAWTISLMVKNRKILAGKEIGHHGKEK